MESTAHDAFTQLRPYLFSVAYRMLGSVTDAEDVLQEAYLRWRKAEDVGSPKAYLAKVVARLSIDHLRSAQVRRESYVGPWLPEPLLTENAPDVVEATESLETLSLALLVLLETLSPVERAVFLLREAFGYEYEEIAEIVGKSPENCRQIAHRAKKHIEARRPRYDPDRRKQDQLLRAFVAATSNGDLEGLTALLGEDVVLWGDGGGKVAAARRPIRGRAEVARFLVGVAAKAPTDSEVRYAEVNGAPGAIVLHGRQPLMVSSLEVANDKIVAIRFVLNPDKLAAVRLPPP